MSDRETAGGEFGVKRLHVAQARAAGGRVADVAARHRARQLGDRFAGREVVGDMAERRGG